MNDDHRLGRWAAWGNAACFVIASIMYLLYSYEITRTAADVDGQPVAQRLAQFFTAERAGFGQEMVFSLLFGLGFLLLAVLGLVLWRRFGRASPAGALGGAALVAGGLIGLVGQLAFVGTKEAILDQSACIECRAADAHLVALSSSLDTIQGATRWIGLGFFLLAGIGVFLLSRANSATAWFPQSVTTLGYVVAALYIAGVIAAMFDLDTLFDILVGVGGAIAAPAWALLIGSSLARGPAARPSERGVASAR